MVGFLARARLAPLLALAMAGFIHCNPARAADPPAAPLLILETGTHSARYIIGISVDGTGRTALTAANDRTARLWSVADGRLLKVFRPQQDPTFAEEGQMSATALSPDGRFAAVGSKTRGAADAADGVVYVFDTRSGDMVRRIPTGTGLPGRMAFTSDGSFLAVALAALSRDPVTHRGINHGSLQVWRTADWSPVASDTDYPSALLALSPDRAGHLATVGADNIIRLYDNGFRVARKSRAPCQIAPEDIAFAPDGSRIAVSCPVENRIRVVSAQDLSTAFEPDAAGLATRGSVLAPAWSADGHTLYGFAPDTAGSDRPGQRNPDRKTYIRRWPDGGRGRATNIPVGDNPLAIIFSIVGLPDGGLAYAGSETLWGTVGAGPPVTVTPASNNLEWDLMERGVDLSPDARQVGLAVDGGRRIVFSVENLTVLPAEQAAADLQPATLSGKAFKVDEVEREQAEMAGSLKMFGLPPETPRPNTLIRSVTVNGHDLEGHPFPMVTNHTAVGKKGLLAAGTNILGLYDGSGRRLWQRTVPSYVAAINQSGDGRLAVAALDDGTVRWYRLRDGAELLALFVRPPDQRWIAWTPSGYYAASPGGEDLIGWLVNRGPGKAADFYGAGRFRDRFYRPDVVQRILTALDEAEALRLASASGQTAPGGDLAADLPPVVRILSPADGSRHGAGQVDVDFLLRAPAGRPVKQIRVLVDGRPVHVQADVPPLAAGQPDAEAAGHISVPVPAGGASTITVLAADDAPRFSEPAEVRVTGTGSTPPAAARKGRLFALVVGIADFAEPKLRLRFGGFDASELARALQGPQQKLIYRSVDVRVLADRAATRNAILDGLRWLRASATEPDDVVLLHVSSHGETDRDRFMFAAADTDLADLDRTTVLGTDVIENLVQIPGRVVVLMDTCEAGGLATAFPYITRFANQAAAAENGVFVFASSVSTQEAQELPQLRHGVFTAALLEAAAGQDGVTVRGGTVDTGALESFLRLRVQQLSRLTQLPVLVRPQEAPDFPLLAVAR